MTLKAYLSHTGKTQSAFAAEVGTTHATISRLLGGEFLPSLRLASKIERASGGVVKATSWTADESAAA